ncbi:MAG: tubulin-like doman-containing protein [Planctomycetota bacterium]
MSDTHDPPPELLQGYTLIDRLGAGGYGEVWRAQAPGGLEKAVKYVFGRQDEARASAELKALERIKDVRHPFLLSLERIEIVDGRLIVVTELADGSLRDRCQACVDDGMPGIPRDELLGYIRDAADALDCLNRDHALQHLDIKPENLLLLAGHVKVADFGLVKHISAQTQSLVGGMTPVYAAPEVFQGKPSQHSDQYSLAIVFQELLTGHLPFVGANAAELTLQHLNNEPCLEHLPEHDRYVLSRALAKDPEYRYDSCGEMARDLASDGVDLSSAGPAGEAARKPRRMSRPAVAPSHSATEVFEAEENPGWSAPDTPILIDTPPSDWANAQDAELPEFDIEDFSASPALFIGIGDGGGRVLRSLRRKLTQKFGADGVPPTLSMLLMDTDAKTLAAATRGSERGAGLSRSETIALPLRRPQEYREKASHLLNWLGRRWLYNIPKTLQTDGIRPLGRLALVDHARQAFQRIRRAMADCVSEENRVAAEASTGKPVPAGSLRVYLCTSVSGGAGGGMSLDVAYAVRSILARLGIEDSRVIGVMMHATSRDLRRGELARVNAYSWLSEYHHFSRVETAYPGDDSCGLPAHEAGVAAFDDAYLINLGAGLDSVAFDDATAAVADYLYVDSVTPIQRLLDATRDATSTEGDGQLRSFAVRRSESIDPQTLKHLADTAIDRLVESWLGQKPTLEDGGEGGDDNVTNPLVHGAPQIVGQLKLDTAGLSSLCRSLLDAHLDANGVAADREGLAPNQLFCVCRDSEEDAPAGPPDAVAGRPVHELVAPLAEKLGGGLQAWVMSRLDVPRERVAGVRRGIDWFRDHLRALRNDLQRLADAAAEQLGEWPTLDEADAKRFRHLTDYASVGAAIGIVDELLGELTTTEQELAAAAESIRTLQPTWDFDPEAETQDEPTPPDANQLGEVLAELKERIEGELLPSLGGLGAAVANETSLARLEDGLGRVARQVASRCLSGAPTQAASTDSSADAAELTPEFAATGSTVRRFVVRPESTSGGENAFGSAGWAQVPTDESAAYWVAEVAELSAPRVAAHVVSRRMDYAKLAERVHTRRDVEWCDLLTSLGSANASETSANEAPANTTEATGTLVQPQATPTPPPVDWSSDSCEVQATQPVGN